MDELFRNESMEPKTTPAPVDQIEAMKARYGKVYQISQSLTIDDGVYRDVQYFFRRPSVASLNRYLKAMSKDATKAMETYLLDCVAQESEQALWDDLDEYPAMVISVGQKLLELQGLGDANLKLL